VRTIGDRERPRRLEQPDRRLQDQARGIAARDGEALGARAEPAGREADQQVDDHADPQRARDLPDRHQRRRAGVDEPGEEPRATADDDEQAEAATRAPRPRGEPRRDVHERDSRKQRHGPRGRRRLQHQRQLRPGHAHRGDPDQRREAGDGTSTDAAGIRQRMGRAHATHPARCPAGPASPRSLNTLNKYLSGRRGPGERA
jgi:hypothetical protein